MKFTIALPIYVAGAETYRPAMHFQVYDLLTVEKNLIKFLRVSCDTISSVSKVRAFI